MSGTVPRILVQRREAALPPALFRRLRTRVLALGTERLRSTYQTTFWYDFSGPTNVVEEAAESLRPRLPPEGLVGVEWWLSRMRTTDIRVDFHQDRDERLALERGAQRHPVLSSVLFLNRVRGGLLAVTEEPPCEDNPALAPARLELDLVAPRPNRFVWFRGDLTHGVLDAENAIPSGRKKGPGEWRFTVVLNWWGRPPLGVPTFEQSRAYRTLATKARTTARPAGG